MSLAVQTKIVESGNVAALLDPNYKVFGADTCLWSLEVDFERYKAAGASFVIIKALHGTTPDPYFKRNYAGARAAGLRISSYHWLLAERAAPVRDQVEAYAALLRDYPVDFVPWLDYEGEVGARDLIRYVDLFLQTTGANLGLYSSFARLNDATPALPDRFSKLKLWIANYAGGFPAVPQPFKTWDMWQFTENFPGVGMGFPADGEQHADMNYFNGSPDTFRSFCDPGERGNPAEATRETRGVGGAHTAAEDGRRRFAGGEAAKRAPAPGIHDARASERGARDIRPAHANRIEQHADCARVPLDRDIRWSHAGRGDRAVLRA